jgi:hypothetical protein
MESPKEAILMVYSKSNSNCFSVSSCSRMYLRMVSSSKPTVLTQYPRLQKCLRFLCAFLTKYRWILTALLPFRNPITNATLNFGGILKHMWTWSAFKFPSNSSIPRCRQRSFIISPTYRLNLPYRFLFRYLGIMTTWYLQPQRTCDKLYQSCIVFPPLIPFGAFQEEKPILFLAGTVEPFRVHH